MTPHLLVYLQDPGSTRCLVPVLQALAGGRRVQRTSYVFHHTARRVVEEERFMPEGTEWVDSERLDEPLWRSRLERSGVTHVLCTIASPRVDRTNGWLIQACRASGLPSLGIMDHWKGFDRFCDEGGNARYRPDWIGCIDEYMCGELEQRFGGADRLFAVGQPALERVRPDSLDEPVPGRGPRVLLVSQPNDRDGSFDGIFLQSREGGRLIDRLADLAPDTASLTYRPHPKEKLATLPAEIEVDTDSIAEIGRRYDWLVGVDSMLMLEGALRGMRTIVLDLPELASSTDGRVPYEYGHRLTELARFPDVLADVRRSLVVDTGLRQIRSALRHSVDRTIALVLSHLDRAAVHG